MWDLNWEEEKTTAVTWEWRGERLPRLIFAVDQYWPGDPLIAKDESPTAPDTEGVTRQDSE